NGLSDCLRREPKPEHASLIGATNESPFRNTSEHPYSPEGFCFIGGAMHKVVEVTKLPAGTLIRHKTTGYQGRIDGITEIKTCFTRGGALAVGVTTKDTFQYRVEIEGEPMRRIAPAEDLEILE